MPSLKQNKPDEVGFEAFPPSAPELARPDTERMHSKIKYLKIHL